MFLYLPPPRRRLSAIRMNIFFLGVLVMFTGLTSGGVWRVHHSWDTLTNLLHASYYQSRVMQAHRGDILDRGGRPLGSSTDEYHAIAELSVLRAVYDVNEEWRANLAAGLSKILSLPMAELEEKLASEKSWVRLKSNISPRAAVRFQQLGIRGLRTEYKSQRFYPLREQLAHITGYTDHRGIGRDGIENARHKQLSPADGEIRMLRTSDGTPLNEFYYRAAKNGDDWRLSIDSRLQFFSYDAVRRAVHHHAAAAAAAVVMDVRDGALLAIANYPSFNPNKIHSVGAEMRNRALSDVVEPGSTIKPFVVALALEKNKIHAGYQYPTEKALRIGNLRVHDEHIKESLAATGIIQKSSNVGAVLLARELGADNLWEWYQTLGFGGAAVLGMPGEQRGQLRHYNGWKQQDFATHAYGYGFSTTLLQLLSAYSVFAADGRMVHPYLDASLSVPQKRVISADTARRVRLMMESVTQEGGTAVAAAVSGYRVAGKTGTTFKFVDKKYDENKRRAFFVGMAPASNPRYLIAVMVDEPRKNGKTGGAVAAPVFQSIMRRALLFSGMTPDMPEIAEVVTDGGNV